MKYFIYLTILLLGFSSCKNVDAKDETAATGSGNTGVTTVEWMDPKKDLGKITEGQKIQISFHLKNTGNSPLVIQSVVPGCGCTLADYPKEPISPGKEAQIIASFDSKGREGQQHKEITVTANTKDNTQHTLSFNVMVVKQKS
jgi:hypothetical protein